MPTRFSFVIVVGLAVTPAQAEMGADLVARGNAHGAIACGACHGATGAGNPQLGYPRLSGMPAKYTVRQLDAFAEGSREHPTMAGIAKALSPDERRAVAAYFETAQAPAELHSGGGDVSRGGSLARDGDWSKGLPACGQCHGADGRGVPPDFPPLAGQSESYLKAQLEAWRQGKRSDDPLHLMTAVATKLADEDVAAVAAYYAGLSPNGASEVRR